MIIKAFRELINKDRDFLRTADRPKVIETNTVFDSAFKGEGGIPRGGVINVVAASGESAFLTGLNIAKHVLYENKRVCIVLCDPDNSVQYLLKAMVGIMSHVAVRYDGDYSEDELLDLEAAIGFLSDEALLDVNYAYGRSAEDIYRDFLALPLDQRPDMILFDSDRLYSSSPGIRYADEYSDRSSAYRVICQLARALGSAVILCEPADPATVVLLQGAAAPDRLVRSVLSHRKWLEKAYGELIVVDRLSFFRRLRDAETDKVSLICSSCNRYAEPAVCTLIHHPSECLEEPDD